MLSREQFEAEIIPLRDALEARRKKYLRYFCAGILIAALLLASALFCPKGVLHGLQRLLQVQAPLKPSDVIAYRAFALLCAAFLPLSPLLGYRKERGLSVERAVLTRILGLFGPFITAQGGGISGGELRRAGFSLTPLLFAPEEGATGEMNSVRVRLCEASLFKLEEGRDHTLAFRGLMILCDLPQAGGAGEPEHSALQERLAAIAETVRTRPCGKARWDERFARAGAGFYAWVKESVISGLGKNELPSEKAYRLKYASPLRKACAEQPHPQHARFAPYTLEYSGQSLLLMVAGLTGFFTLGSVFAPALGPARTDRFYEVMRVVDTLTRDWRKGQTRRFI
jgi:hypothetical protein